MLLLSFYKNGKRLTRHCTETEYGFNKCRLKEKIISELFVKEDAWTETLKIISRDAPETELAAFLGVLLQCPFEREHDFSCSWGKYLQVQQKKLDEFLQFMKEKKKRPHFTKCVKIDELSGVWIRGRIVQHDPDEPKWDFFGYKAEGTELYRADENGFTHLIVEGWDEIRKEAEYDIWHFGKWMAIGFYVSKDPTVQLNLYHEENGYEKAAACEWLTSLIHITQQGDIFYVGGRHDSLNMCKFETGELLELGESPRIYVRDWLRDGNSKLNLSMERKALGSKKDGTALIRVDERGGVSYSDLVLDMEEYVYVSFLQKLGEHYYVYGEKEDGGRGFWEFDDTLTFKRIIWLDESIPKLRETILLADPIENALWLVSGKKHCFVKVNVTSGETKAVHCQEYSDFWTTHIVGFDRKKNLVAAYDNQVCIVSLEEGIVDRQRISGRIMHSFWNSQRECCLIVCKPFDGPYQHNIGKLKTELRKIIYK